MVDLYIIRGMQSKSRTGTKPKPAKIKKTNGEELAAPMEKLAVDETPRVKSKNLNVVEEFEKSGMKRMANFVVIGQFMSLSQI